MPCSPCLSSLVVLAVKISKSFKMLAQLLGALGSPSETLPHCKGLVSCALSPRQLVQDLYVLPVLLPLLSKMYQGRGMGEGFEGHPVRDVLADSTGRMAV